jgi:hypothetical protein
MHSRPATHGQLRTPPSGVRGHLRPRYSTWSPRCPNYGSWLSVLRQGLGLTDHLGVVRRSWDSCHMSGRIREHCILNGVAFVVCEFSLVAGGAIFIAVAFGLHHVWIGVFLAIGILLNSLVVVAIGVVVEARGAGNFSPQCLRRHIPGRAESLTSGHDEGHPCPRNFDPFALCSDGFCRLRADSITMNVGFGVDVGTTALRGP